ncbi:MAG: tRNA (N6-isopentenyl adenosine(37)-C2)-methylthiotransferase MiaB [Desulfomonile tiedjei]|nr:tRNA (N6-isopentenyl adenosine(37)-C2)-methylthiotransferase MiaB [Desulfomonile tiedjei]
MKRLFGGRYYIETYGCQMNEHDSQKMSALLEELGMTEAASADQADVVVINTCSVREKPEHKVYSALGTLKAAKTRNPAMVTVVAGCVAQQERDKLLKRVSHLDIVLGTHAIGELPALVGRVRETGERISCTDFRGEVSSLHMHAPIGGEARICSYVTIMQGCSNFCSYCVVPFTRGPEMSRPERDVIDEVRGIVAQGGKEVTLLGQNVNAYGKDLEQGPSFSHLLRQLDRIEGLRRVRFTTSHPKDFDEGLASAMADMASVCEHIHLPLQSGADNVLRAMKRSYDYAAYREKVRLLRQKVPGVAITADMIVGFPGESEADFQQTLAALEEIRFDQIFSFKFSPRPGTDASRLPDQVPEDVKIARLARVHQIQEAITSGYHLAAEGTTAEVLVEEIKQQTGQARGRTRTNKVVNLGASEGILPGDLVRVEIVRGLKHSLLGKKAD